MPMICNRDTRGFAIAPMMDITDFSRFATNRNDLVVAKSSVL